MALRKIALVGLPCVGLAVAVACRRAGAPVIDFDINAPRVRELKADNDTTREIYPDDLNHKALLLTSDSSQLNADFFVLTIPMPIDDARQPNLTALLKASATVGRAPQSGDIVVYASTVYPGATEEDCVPVLEQESGLKEEPISPSVTRQNVSIRATAAPKQSKWRPLKPKELSIRAVLKSRWGFTIAFAAQGQVRSVDRTEVDL